MRFELKCKKDVSLSSKEERCISDFKGIDNFLRPDNFFKNNGNSFLMLCLRACTISWDLGFSPVYLYQ